MAEPATTSALVKYGLPAVVSLLGGIFGGGGSGGSKEAVAAQAALNKELLDIMRQQMAMENPYRKQLLQGLSQRASKAFPGFSLPAQPPQFNPYARMKQLGAGGQAPDPGGYVELLRVAYSAVKEMDPQALVISAGLAPTNRLDTTAMDDRIYLEGMYEAGAREVFGVLGVHPYGFAYPPDDLYGAHQGLNFARLEDVREIMVANGDADKPVWATEVGWVAEAVKEEQAWLQVTEEQQAAYLIAAFERAGEEWLWLERIAVWNLSVGLETDDEKRGYSIIDDGYVPRPAYEALVAMPKRDTAETTPSVSPETNLVQVLARDVVIRLGDVDTFHPHWTRIYGGEAPCRSWRGEFYVDQPEDGNWQLCLEIMQVEEQGNLVKIRGRVAVGIDISSWPASAITIAAETQVGFSSGGQISSSGIFIPVQNRPSSSFSSSAQSSRSRALWFSPMRVRARTSSHVSATVIHQGSSTTHLHPLPSTTKLDHLS